MDNYNWLVTALFLEQRLRERSLPQRYEPLQPSERRETLSRVKRGLASTLVRLGLRLDPAAGEGLGALDLGIATPEAGPRA
jgi:hypothetical protein